MKNSRKIILWAGFLGFFGVLVGALGAHALQARLAAANMEQVWQTAVLYQLIHAIALLALATFSEVCAMKSQDAPQRLVDRAADCWVAGVMMFSGSLYILALGGPRWIGPVTPLGGLALLAGWVLVAVAGTRK